MTLPSPFHALILSLGLLATSPWPLAPRAPGRQIPPALGPDNGDVELVRSYREAAFAGDVEAQSDLGWSYRNGMGVARDERNAFYWYGLAARRGFAPAQAALGCLYLNARGRWPNETKAFHWTKLAARQGHPMGEASLAWMYQQGIGTGRDGRKAAYWFRKAHRDGFDVSKWFKVG